MYLPQYDLWWSVQLNGLLKLAEVLYAKFTCGMEYKVKKIYKLKNSLLNKATKSNIISNIKNARSINNIYSNSTE